MDTKLVWGNRLLCLITSRKFNTYTEVKSVSFPGSLFFPWRGKGKRETLRRTSRWDLFPNSTGKRLNDSKTSFNHLSLEVLDFIRFSFGCSGIAGLKNRSWWLQNKQKLWHQLVGKFPSQLKKSSVIIFNETFTFTNRITPCSVVSQVRTSHRLAVSHVILHVKLIIHEESSVDLKSYNFKPLAIVLHDCENFDMSSW